MNDTDLGFLDDPALVESPVVRAMLMLPASLRPQGLAARAAVRFESGQLRSKSLRRLLWEANDVRVGAYSYGGMLELTRARRPGLIIDRYVSLSYSARWGINHHLHRTGTSPVFDPKLLESAEQPELLPGLHICSDVWVGDFAVFTGTCRRVGLGAVVGAGAVVTRDVPDFAIVTGAPARVQRYRFDETIREHIRRSQWWEHDLLDLQPWMPQLRAGPETPEGVAALDEIAALGDPRATRLRPTS